MKRMNLMPPEFAPGKASHKASGVSIQIFFYGLIVLAGFAGHYGFARLRLARLESGVEALKEEYSSRQVTHEQGDQIRLKLNEQLSDLEGKMKLLDQKRAELLRLSQGEFKWSEVLKEFNRSIPEGVWADRMSLNYERSMVAGGAQTNQDISRFILALSHNRFFKNVGFQKTEAGELNGQAVVNFELGLELAQKYGVRS